MLFPNIQMKIIGEKGDRLHPNETGEIHVKLLQNILGYFEEPEKSREALDEDGWVKTGDLGYFDDECFLFITGRKKEMLKYNNYQVLPSELEELINSVDGVESSSIVGILDENSGNDIIFAFVKKNPRSDLNEEKILKFVHDKVIDAKKIRGGVHFIDSFPLTPSGKVKKNELKNLAESFVKLN